MGKRWERAQTLPSAIWLLVIAEEFRPVPEWCHPSKCPEIKSWRQQETYCVTHTILSAPDMEVVSCHLEERQVWHICPTIILSG